MSSPLDGASRLGQVISGRYEIRELLGEGGMGSVYLAEHTHMKKRVALKLLHPEMHDNGEVLERFRREAEAASRIEHPNVASATDFGKTEDGGFFLVLEYVDGTSLRSAIEEGPMTAHRAIHIARQIAAALERAHEMGVVHRDLKPENVMLVRREDDTDFVKVLDFGIAKVEGVGRESGTQPLTKFGTLLGTPEYMAPEQALGETVSPSADLYALGVIFYELLTGKHPFDASDRMAVLSMHIVAPVPEMRSRVPYAEVAPGLEAIVRKLLEKEPKNRPESARAFIEALDAAAREIGVLASTPGPLPALQTPAPSPSEKWIASDAYARTEHGTPAPAPRPHTKGPSKLTLQAVIAAGVAFLVVVLIASVAVARCGRTTKTDSAGGNANGAGRLFELPKSKKAGDAALAKATEGGSVALQALAKEYPEDVGVKKQLALAYDAEKKPTEALQAVAAVATMDTDAVDDALLGIVLTSIHANENNDDEFALLEGPLGTRGVDALIELLSRPSQTIQKRAAKSLAKPEVRAKATPAAAIYLDLRAAKTCSERKELLERAKKDGDPRSLPLLKQTKLKGGCGFMGMKDCWGCMRKDTELDDAIDAVQARVTAP